MWNALFGWKPGWNWFAIVLAASLYGESAIAYTERILGSSQWSLISIPADPEGPYTVESLFGDELPSDGYGRSEQWWMYVYDSAAGQYRLLALNETLKANTGYWMFQRTGSEVTLDIPMSVPALAGTAMNGCIAGRQCVSIPLTGGSGISAWNLVGYSSESQVLFGETRFVTASGACADGCTPAQARAENVANSIFYRLNHAGDAYEQVEETTRLQPWDAYWALSLPGASALEWVVPVDSFRPDSDGDTRPWPGAIGAVQSNALVNGSFESGTLGWKSCGGGALVALDDAGAASTAGIRLADQACINQTINLDVVQDYTLSCQIRSSGSSVILSASTLPSETIQSTNALIAGTGFNVVSVSFRSPGEPVVVSLRTDTSVDIDNCVVAQGTVAAVEPFDPTAQSGNLLMNGDFARGQSFWRSCISGSGVVSTTSGSASLSSGGCLLQMFPVSPGENYTLRCDARSDANYSSHELIVLDAELKQFDSSGEQPVTSGDFASYASAVEAPSDATAGMVVLHAESAAEFDNCEVYVGERVAPPVVDTSLVSGSLNNGDFAGNLSNWTVCGGSPTISSGGVNNSRALNLDAGGCAYQLIRVPEEDEYTLSCLASSQEDSANLRLSLLDARFAELQSVQTSVSGLSLTEYNTSLSASADATYAVASLYSSSDASFDNCRIVALSTQDSDNDGVINSEDAFPNDPAETRDSDGDGVGDNADVFPINPDETSDSDGDGVGDNADAFPNDPARTSEEDDDGEQPEIVIDPVQGPGLGNLSYSNSEVFTQVSVPLIDNSTGILPPDFPGAKRYGVNVSTMLNGYMLGIFAPDSGGGPGGWIAMDVSNPKNMDLVHRVYEPDTVQPSRSGDARRTAEFREPHAIGLSQGNLAAIQSGRGIEIWDWSDVFNPVQRSKLSLPGVNFGDYANVAWQLFWQAPYLYVARSERGIDIVNTSDIDNPFLEASIPISELGGFGIGAIFALGNEMYISSVQTTAGFSILDISNPVAPRLVKNVRQIPRLYYSSCWDGRYAYFMTRAANEEKHVYDTSTTPITLVNGSFRGFNSLYCTLQDNKVIFGNQTDIGVLDVTDPRNISVIGSGSLETTSNDVDHGQAFPFGNLVWVGNDHGTGNGLIAQSAAPDTTPPQLVRAMPASGELNLPVSSRIGVSLSDSVLMESVNETTFRVRRIGSNESLSGRYSANLGFVNFTPESALLDNETYEVRLEGIQDFAGNPMAAYTYRFSTGGSLGHVAALQVNAQRTITGTTSDFLASAEPIAGGTVEYSWNFGDGNATPFARAGTASHVYSEPGHYSAVVTVREGALRTTRSIEMTIFNPLAPQSPTRSKTITSNGTSVFAVNEDNDTVTAISATAPFNKQWETAVGDMPRTIATDNQGRIWVTSQGDATVSILDTAGQVQSQINVGRGTQPYGVAITPDGATAVITLQATGEVVLIDTGSLAITNRVSVGQSARAITIDSGSQTAYVTRFVSPKTSAEVVSVNLASGSVNVITLEKDTTTVDGADRARGIFNYLSGISMAPDGQTAWLTANKANVERGVFRDNQNLTFETTIRAATTQISTSTLAELTERRMDIDNRAQPKDIEFSRLGDYVYIAIEGQNAIEIRDAYDRSRAGELINTGLAPRGMTKVGSSLFVHNFMSRSIAVYDVSRYEDGLGGNPQQLASTDTVASESLHPRVLAGKQIFYNAQDPRMTRDGYISCASCHADSGSDNRVWDFTERGEGLRNTVSLKGRMGTGLGNVHWTANFDEIHDFENDIRSGFGGLGFLTDSQFAATSDPLGSSKAGLNNDLDNLAFYLGSLNEFPVSPARDPSGDLTPLAVQGRQVFESQGCASCHSGELFTDQLRHDVGTVQASSGLGIRQPLSGVGFKTPTLISLFETAPYFHNGQAETLEEVLQTGAVHTVDNAADRALIVEYLEQIEYEGPERVQEEIPEQGPSDIPPSSAIFCASEEGVCTIPTGQTATVWYGSGDSWNIQSNVTGAIICNNVVFGDPIPTIFKSCLYTTQEEIPEQGPSAIPPSSAIFCASEEGVCTIPTGQTATVWYGSGDSWNIQSNVAGAIICNNGVFGDPIRTIVKSCRYVTD